VLMATLKLLTFTRDTRDTRGTQAWRRNAQICEKQRQLKQRQQLARTWHPSPLRAAASQRHACQSACPRTLRELPPRPRKLHRPRVALDCRRRRRGRHHHLRRHRRSTQRHTLRLGRRHRAGHLAVGKRVSAERAGTVHGQLAAASETAVHDLRLQ
jgi:hypothetical protein